MIFDRSRIAVTPSIIILFAIGLVDSARSQVIPPVIARLSEKVPANASAEVFYKQVPESLWDVYQENERLKTSLVDFIKRAPDGPTLGYAALALIPFHDPATVRPMLERAMQPTTSPASRWCMLNAAPYVLGMGDVMYMGDGKLDEESKEVAAGLIEFSDGAAKSGTGHMHAVGLRKLLDLPVAEQKGEDYELAVWHTSAYLLGTIDLKDVKTLAPALTSKYRTVFQNSIVALSFQANRDFLAELKKKTMDEVTPAMEQSVGKSAVGWWENYLTSHPSGDWTDAVLEGFAQAGYKVESDFKSPQSTRELLRAVDDTDPILRYNAYRVFNRIYATNFDLDVAFFAGKYALSFLDPSGREKANEARLKRYWKSRLQPQTADLQASPAVRAVNESKTASAMTDSQPLSLADQARRLRQQKGEKK